MLGAKYARELLEGFVSLFGLGPEAGWGYFKGDNQRDNFFSALFKDAHWVLHIQYPRMK